jgi:RIO kinase 2
VECIKAWFFKRLGFEAATWPVLNVDTEKKYSLDVAIAASGFSKEDQQEFEKVILEKKTIC